MLITYNPPKYKPKKKKKKKKYSSIYGCKQRREAWTKEEERYCTYSFSFSWIQQRGPLWVERENSKNSKNSKNWIRICNAQKFAPSLRLLGKAKKKTITHFTLCSILWPLVLSLYALVYLVPLQGYATLVPLLDLYPPHINITLPHTLHAMLSFNFTPKRKSIYWM